MDSGLIQIRDLTTGKELPAFDDHREGVPIEVFPSPDGRRVATLTEREVRLWELPTGKMLTCLRGRFDSGVVWTADGRAFTMDERNPQGWRDPDNGKPVKPLAPRAVGPSPDREHIVSPDGRYLFRLQRTSRNGGGYWDLTLLDMQRDRVVLTQRDLPYVCRFSFSGDGRLLLGVTTRGVRAWEVATGKEVSARLPTSGDATRCESVCVSWDGRMAALTVPSTEKIPSGEDSLLLERAACNLLLFETATGRLRRKLPQIDGIARCAFTRDGRYLVSGSTDGTGLVWDVYAPLNDQGGPLTADEARQLWEVLASDDAGKAFAAVCRLIVSPAQAVALAEERVKPFALDRGRVELLLTDLGSMQFRTRTQATQELAALGEDIEPLLREALKGNNLPLEVRRRIQTLLDRLEGRGGGPASWRLTRTVEVLERVGTPAALRLLRTWAGSESDSRLKREAVAAMRRLSGKAP
jgi:hypothetical protein